MKKTVNRILTVLLTTLSLTSCGLMEMDTEELVAVEMQLERDTVYIMVGDQYASIYGTRIRSDSYDYQETKPAERTFTLDLNQGESKNFWINVAYEYGGTYFGVRLDSIECGGNVTLTR